MFVKQLLTALKHKPPIVVGIDPDLPLIHSHYPQWVDASLSGTTSPERVADLYREYTLAIIDAVHDLVPAVKPQSAFFEVWGHHGIKVLEEVVERSREQGLLVIMDVKRGDVPSTAQAYARAYLDKESPLASDAVTINPYLGRDSLAPFFHRLRGSDSPGIFTLIKTSNSGSDDLQDLIVEDRKLYEYWATLLQKEILSYPLFENYSPIGAVVGATYPEAARSIRQLLPHSFFLVPGLGVQGGDIERIKDYLNHDNLGALFSFSRSLIYPSSSTSLSYGLFEIKRDIREATIQCIKKLRKYL